MEKVIHKLINEFTEGVDTYTHNGSTWLIFTESKQWVIELTESKTLWYNYNFFKTLFNYTSMDVVDNQQYITKWVEDNIINKVERTSQSIPIKSFSVDYIIQDGVKHTYIGGGRTNIVEDTLQDGVIKTKGFKMRTDWSIEDTIENGVKRTKSLPQSASIGIEDAIQNGVKRTFANVNEKIHKVEDSIQNGVRHTDIGWHQCNNVDDTIEKGIKETRPEINITEGEVDDIIQDGVKEIKGLGKSEVTEKEINNTIQNGIKETIECDWNIPKYVINEVVNDGVKETSHKCLLKRGEIEDIIDGGVKETQFNSYVNESWVEGVIKEGVKLTGRIHKDYTKVVEYLIDNGVKQTKHNPFSMITNVENAIKNGVKETDYREVKTCGEINDIVNNGVKKTKEMDEWVNTPRIVGYVIENGIKETKQKKNALLILDNSGRELILESHLVIRDGVKITSSLQSREYTGDIDEVLENGVKETHYDTDNYTDDVKEVIREGVRTSHPRQYVGGDIVDKVIDKGVIETHGEIREYKQTVGYIIQTGVKETKTPGNGDIASTAEWMKENNSTSYPKMIDDIIENGYKVSGTFVGGKRQKENIESVIDYGTKNPTD